MEQSAGNIQLKLYEDAIHLCGTAKVTLPSIAYVCTTLAGDAQLVIGDKAYGKYRWNVVKHSAKYTAHDKNGNPICAEVALELQEYLKA